MQTTREKLTRSAYCFSFYTKLNGEGFLLNGLEDFPIKVIIDDKELLFLKFLLLTAEKRDAAYEEAAPEEINNDIDAYFDPKKIDDFFFNKLKDYKVKDGKTKYFTEEYFEEYYYKAEEEKKIAKAKK
jgi:hypothetical protein